MRILVVHHVRNHESAEVYRSDSYIGVSNLLYGAQEMDTWAGIRLMESSHEVWRLEICTNGLSYSLADDSGRILKSGFFSLLKPYFSAKYLRAFFKYWDPAIIQFGDTSLCEIFESAASLNEFDVIWSDTQFYFPFLKCRIPVIIRSVNFEPIHVLAEDSSPFRYLRFFLKIFGERVAFKRNTLVPISPLDSFRYQRILLNPKQVIPLRQLCFLEGQSQYKSIDSDYFVVMGSSFQVRHNFRNLEFCISELSPILHKVDPSLKILIFGTRAPLNLHIPSNIQMMGFSEKYFEYLEDSLGVIVPFHGGAGMQSKVFEPLSLGIPVVANPRSMVGYPFLPEVHFLGAESGEQYVKMMSRLKGDENLRTRLSREARQLSSEVFHKEKILSGINQILKESVSNL